MHDRAPLVSKAVRIDKAALDDVLAQRSMTSGNKRRVRAKMQTLLNPWSFVTVPLTLPLGLAEELRGLSDLSAQLDDFNTAQAILKDVHRAITIAKTKVLDVQ